MTKDPTQWAMSSFTDGVQCAELRVNPVTGRVEFRDTEDPDTVVDMSVESTRAMFHGVMAGEFTHLVE